MRLSVLKRFPMDQIKKIILLHVPTSICNFRCHYCYLSQRKECYQGVQPHMQYTPQQVAAALSRKRLSGLAFINICAEGETLLTNDIDLYIKALAEEGHYIEVVTNLVITSMLEKILRMDAALLRRIEFKCSFHYLELKKRKLLDVFAENVKKIWDAGASANIEITPSDELIPYINEVKEFSLKHFGALPHITIARDDRTKGIDYLTKLNMADYDGAWSTFESDFWTYKKTIFGKKQKDFCYAGRWSLYVNLATGTARQCYCGKSFGNIFENPDEPFPEEPIGKCGRAHCYNGHALLTLGLIPNATPIGYGDIRNRVREDGSEWLQPELKAFFNTKLVDSNSEYSMQQKRKAMLKNNIDFLKQLPPKVSRKAHRLLDDFGKNKKGKR